MDVGNAVGFLESTVQTFDKLLEWEEFFGYFIAIGKTDDLGEKVLNRKWISTVAIRNKIQGLFELVKGHAHGKDTGEPHPWKLRPDIQRWNEISCP